MNTPDPLIAELRTLRHMLGIRAADIAARTGINLASISNWECGRTLPRLETLRPYARAIGFELTLTPTEETTDRLPLLDLTADEIRALAVNAAGWLQLGDDPTLRSALTKLGGGDALDADDYPPDYDLDLCQPADTTLPPVAPYGHRRDDVTTVHLPAHDIA